MIPISHESLGYDIGIVHNEMMRDAKDYDGFNFSSITSALASIETFQREFYSNYDTALTNHPFIIEATESLEPEVIEARLAETGMILSTLKLNSVITNEEYQILVTVKNLAENNASGAISNQDFYEAVIALNESATEIEEMKLASNVLAITLASCEYWIDGDNLEHSEEKNQVLAVPAWVAADGAGAVWGAAVSALRQYNATGNVSLKETATAALIGAAASSLGIVGKIAKGIKSLF